MERKYFNQVSLLVRILPEIARISQFALHGGTAINLFHHNMPRLSVDIDLTLADYGERNRDLSIIHELLEGLQQRLSKIIQGIKIKLSSQDSGEFKLICILQGALVKVEVNTINRGIISAVEIHRLCPAAQQNFNSFVEMALVPESQLFGGKIVAALDRQHPRDIFDIKMLLDRNRFDQKIMSGFLFCLLSSNRPIHELLNPVLSDQRSALNNQFAGMTDEIFTYEMFEQERQRLLKTIQLNLTGDHKRMLLSVQKGNPDWSYEDWSYFPGISWKLKNLELLRTNNSIKYREQTDILENILAGK